MNSVCFEFCCFEFFESDCAFLYINMNGACPKSKPRRAICWLLADWFTAGHAVDLRRLLRCKKRWGAITCRSTPRESAGAARPAAAAAAEDCCCCSHLPRRPWQRPAPRQTGRAAPSRRRMDLIGAVLLIEQGDEEEPEREERKDFVRTPVLVLR